MASPNDTTPRSCRGRRQAHRLCRIVSAVIPLAKAHGYDSAQELEFAVAVRSDAVTIVR